MLWTGGAITNVYALGLIVFVSVFHCDVRNMQAIKCFCSFCVISTHLVVL